MLVLALYLLFLQYFATLSVTSPSSHKKLKPPLVLINGTCYLANQELAFHGNDESATSFNCGNYVELIYAFAENDERISRHLEISTVFSGLSNRIQNDIIEAVAEVIRTDIREI